MAKYRIVRYTLNNRKSDSYTVEKYDETYGLWCYEKSFMFKYFAKRYITSCLNPKNSEFSIEVLEEYD